MLMKHYFFIFVCLFILVSCKNDPLIAFKETTISTDENSTVEVNIPLAEGNTEMAQSINKTIKNSVIYALQIGAQNMITSKSIEESIKAFDKDFHDFLNDFPESEQHWEAQIDGDVMHQSEDIISIAITSYVDTGGAHGSLNISFLNFNAQTGKTILNTDLFKDKKAFYNLAKSYFLANVSAKDSLFEPEKFVLPANIGYTVDGIILLYNTYEIADYSEGVIEFTIPYDKVNSLLVFDSLQ